MPCRPLVAKKGKNTVVVGHICFANPPIKMCKGVWMEWHNYFGPNFFSDRACSKLLPDWYEDRKIVEAFDKWFAKRKEDDHVPPG